MRFMQWAADGGEGSGVQALYLLEVKSLVSIVILRFNPGTREAYHSHAFNAFTIFLDGECVEERLDGKRQRFLPGDFKLTKRSTFHRVRAGAKGAPTLTFRGPWSSTWQESRRGKIVTLTHGRKELSR